MVTPKNIHKNMEVSEAMGVPPVISVITHLYMEFFHEMAACQNPVPLVNIKIAGKWMFIPLKMVLIGIDPSPNQPWLPTLRLPGNPQGISRLPPRSSRADPCVATAP